MDSSNFGIGVTLFQTLWDGISKRIGYWSRSLLPTEKNYYHPPRKYLAVVWAIKNLRPYIPYKKVTVYKDHSALHWLINNTKLLARLTRWRLQVAEFDSDIKYKKAKKTNLPLPYHASALMEKAKLVMTTMSDLFTPHVQHVSPYQTWVTKTLITTIHTNYMISTNRTTTKTTIFFRPKTSHNMWIHHILS